MTKVYLGKDKETGDRLFLDKHTWDCGWYWGFGYVGNNDLHYHFSSYLKGQVKPFDDILTDTKLSNDNWWVLRDLFKQAYSLQSTAEVYGYGGYQSRLRDVTGILKSPSKEAELTKDLGLILDTLWDYITTICGEIDD